MGHSHNEQISMEPRLTCGVGRTQSAGVVVVYVCVSSGGYGIRSGSREWGWGYEVVTLLSI